MKIIFVCQNTIKIGGSAFFVFLLFKEKKKGKKITGISGFGFFWSKNGRFVTPRFL